MLVLRDVECMFVSGRWRIATVADLRFTRDRIRPSATEETGPRWTSYIPRVAERQRGGISALVNEFFISYSDTKKVRLLKKDWPRWRWQRARLSHILSVASVAV